MKLPWLIKRFVFSSTYDGRRVQNAPQNLHVQMNLKLEDESMHIRN